MKHDLQLSPDSTHAQKGKPNPGRLNGTEDGEFISKIVAGGFFSASEICRRRRIAEAPAQAGPQAGQV